MRDGDGNRVYFGSSLPYADFLEEDNRALRTGLRNKNQLPESRRAVLAYFIGHPGSTGRKCANALGVLSVDRRVSDFLAIGYLRVTRKAARMADSGIKITDLGVEACERERPTFRSTSAPYDIYVPPKPLETRAGSSDALKIKSKGNA